MSIDMFFQNLMLHIKIWILNYLIWEKYKINIEGSESFCKKGKYKGWMMLIYFNDTWDLNLYSYIAIIVY